ncbi:unnamed protein product [Gemmata massiliana]|uniref:Uncharacterized protein n=1 Tax=Gemmata massiliana TaxID=1210884 RepID=A0A6P2DI90_9BACT|nr:hypothetical protein [Gemmata massiliana]VTS01756.1 unnamed protein product [Gemmata massiliana]
MNRARKGKSPARRQSTIQLCTFAAEIQRKITGDLKENRTIVASAAVLAFSKLPQTQQLDLCKEARQQHTAPVGG